MVDGFEIEVNVDARVLACLRHQYIVTPDAPKQTGLSRVGDKFFNQVESVCLDVPVGPHANDENTHRAILGSIVNCPMDIVHRGYHRAIRRLPVAVRIDLGNALHAAAPFLPVSGQHSRIADIGIDTVFLTELESIVDLVQGEILSEQTGYVFELSGVSGSPEEIAAA